MITVRQRSDHRIIGMTETVNDIGLTACSPGLRTDDTPPIVCYQRLNKIQQRGAVSLMLLYQPGREGPECDEGEQHKTRWKLHSYTASRCVNKRLRHGPLVLGCWLLSSHGLLSGHRRDFSRCRMQRLAEGGAGYSRSVYEARRWLVR